MSSRVEFPLSTAAYAIDTSALTLKNWFARCEMNIGTKNQARGWRFTFIDIANLAIIRRLVDFGMSVEIACKQTRLEIIEPIYGKNLRCLNLDENETTEPLRGLQVFCYIDRSCAGGWALEVRKVIDFDLPNPAVLVIDLAKVVEIAIARAKMLDD